MRAGPHERETKAVVVRDEDTHEQQLCIHNRGTQTKIQLLADAELILYLFRGVE